MQNAYRLHVIDDAGRLVARRVCAATTDHAALAEAFSAAALGQAVEVHCASRLVCRVPGSPLRQVAGAAAKAPASSAHALPAQA